MNRLIRHLVKILISAMMAGCSPGATDPTSPSPIATSAVVNTDESPVSVEPLSMTVSPIRPPCMLYGDLPDRLDWAIVNAPLDARIDKGYHFDDTPGCEPTLANQRTQNDHLRTAQVGSNIGVAYDKFAFACRGRTQVDVDVNGVGVVRLVINNPTGPICASPPSPQPPPTPEPPTDFTCPDGLIPVLREGLTCEVPPPAPTCEEVNQPSFEGLRTTRSDQEIQSSVTVVNAAQWKVVLYAAEQSSGYPNNPTYTKATTTAQLLCGEARTLRVSYVWARHSASVWWTKLFKDGVVVAVGEMVTK